MGWHNVIWACCTRMASTALLKRARQLFVQGAEKGSAGAQGNMASLFSEDHASDAEMFRDANLAAQQGGANGFNVRGACYEHGRGVQAAMERAVMDYRRSAGKGHPLGQNNLGACYLSGRGVPKNAAKAFELFKLSADQGTPAGCNNVGFCYANGVGVERNLELGIAYFREAAAQHFQPAIDTLQQLGFVEVATAEARTSQKKNLRNSMKRFALLALSMAIAIAMLCTLAQGARRRRKSSPPAAASPSVPQQPRKVAKRKWKLKKAEPMDQDVFERGLVRADITARKLAAEAHRYYGDSDVRRRQISDQNDQNDANKWKSKSLAFVTPWNSKGYENAIEFAHKLDFVSPCWLRTSDDDVHVEGAHDIDVEWMQRLKEASHGAVKIVPRLSLARMPPSDVVAKLLAADTCARLRVAGDAVDGVAIDLSAAYSPQLGAVALERIAALSAAMRESCARPDFAVVVALHGAMASRTLVDGLIDRAAVDLIHLSAYDYGSQQLSGIAPFPWVERIIEQVLPAADARVASRIVMGINFYGREYALGNGEPATSGPTRDIVGDSFLETLTTAAEHVRIDYDSAAREHIFTYTAASDGQVRIIFYPTLLSISERLDLFERHGLGYSIWDLGQGLPYFFDLL
jgi:chitinase domain-containing protein 1